MREFVTPLLARHFLPEEFQSNGDGNDKDYAAMTEKTCDDMENALGLNFIEMTPRELKVMKALGCASFICSAIVAILIYNNRKIQAHPFYMIAFMSFCDSCSFWYIVMMTEVCQLGLNEFFAKTVLISSNDAYTTYLATKILNGFVLNLISYFVNVGMLLNTCLCLDLILIIRDPFGKMDTRSRRYIILCSVIAFIPNFTNDV